MAEKTIDHGHQSLAGLADIYRSLQLANASESDTRAKVIDSILKGVLYWTEQDITREERSTEDGTTQFIDYVLRTATVIILVEAKKAGAAFVLPNQRSSGKLGGWLSEGAVGDAVRQARDYCRRNSIPFAVVTNGSAWIVFPALRTDGVPFEETQARVFRSIADIEERFVEFWELLSRQRVIEGNLENELLAHSGGAQSSRLISVVNEPGYRLGRNALFDHLEPAVSTALSDEALLTDVDALSSCYVRTSERIRFDKRLSMHLTDVKPKLERPAIRVRSRKSKEAVEQAMTGAPQGIQRFVLVLGPVGAGKSTFLSYFRNVSARNLIEGKLLWFQIDFKRATASDSPRDFIYRELLRQIEGDDQFDLGDWEHSIRPAYRDEIAKLERGVLRPLKEGSPQLFEQKVSEHIASDRERVEPYVERVLQRALRDHVGYLVVDNVDQLETDEAQNRTFVEAQAAARRIGINVIMSLRDATYLRHRSTPTFDAFQVETMFIDPPSAIPVLSRRFAYARRMLTGAHARIRTESGATVMVDDLGAFFEIVSRSMLGENPGFMLDVLSGGDIRRALLLAREFLASGHTNADSALQSFISGRSYQFPAHEIFKGAVLGARRYYREEESLLLNLFDSKLREKSLSLMRLHLVSYLVRAASQPGFEGLPYEQLTDWLHMVGVHEGATSQLCDALLRGRVLRTGDGLDLSDRAVLLPTRLAGYLLQELSWTLQYLEMCVMDANIYDEETFDVLANQTRGVERRGGDMLVRLNLRIDRMNKFLEYTRLIEETWIVECRRKGVPETLGDPVVAKQVIPNFRTIEAPRVLESARRRFEHESVRARR